MSEPAEPTTPEATIPGPKLTPANKISLLQSLLVNASKESYTKQVQKAKAELHRL